jgi:putative hemolysin
MAEVSWLAAVGIVLFGGASFFFALAETAMFSLSKWQVRQLVERAPKRGGVVNRLLAHPQELLGALALGNTLASAAVIAIALWMGLRGEWLLVWTVVATGVLLLLGCEVLPKTLAVRRPESWALRVAQPLFVWHALVRPFRQVAQRLNEVILRVIIPKSIKPANTITDADYRELLEMAYQHDVLAKSERDIILEIVRLDQRMVKDVMRPRAKMDGVTDTMTMKEMCAAARRLKHRRLPMYDEENDTIIGVLNTRELLLNPDSDLEEAMEFPSFVPESMNLLQLLVSLQRQQRGLALVLDEYGELAGIVTLEIILEELVGDIRSEGEVQEFKLEKLAAGRWRVNGTLKIDEFGDEYPELGEVPEVETMGGLLMAQLGVVPGAGESVVFRGLKLTAKAVDERRVREVLVEVLKRKGGAA